MNGETEVKVSNLRLSNLPTTVVQYQDNFEQNSENTNQYGVIRAMNRQRNNQNNVRKQVHGKTAYMDRNPQYRNKPMSHQQRYNPWTCAGCGMYGHSISMCRNVLKIALAIKYIKDKPQHVDKLITEYKRVNAQSTKKSVIRILLASDESNEFIDPDEYLLTNDVHIDMEPVLDEQQ